ncbi:zinc-ribbon domain-containing protein [Vagococcus carniphilus]|uniref:zinc ribbon domain-containing protein n=1 Tax=Vagococcus carniphilus TaxID=218144 RepID=UPI003B5C7594
MTKFCTNCGTELPEESKFCSKCGTKLNSDVVVSSTEQTSFTETKSVQAKYLTKNKWPFVLGIAFILIMGVWLFNKNPMTGDWVSESEGVEVGIKGNSAELMFPDFLSDMSISFEGPIKKVSKKEYVFPINTSTVKVTFRDAVSNQEDVEETFESLKDEVMASDLPPKDQKKIQKTFDSLQKSGDDLILSMSMKDYEKMASVDSVDFLELDEFINFEFSIRPKGSTQIVFGDREHKEESFLMDKKVEK